MSRPREARPDPQLFGKASLQEGLRRPYLQKEMSPPCSKCLSRRRQLQTRGNITRESRGSWHGGLCALPCLLLRTPSGFPSPSHGLQAGGWGALRSCSLPSICLCRLSSALMLFLSPQTPGPLHGLVWEGSTRSWLHALGQVTPSRASVPTVG